MPGLSPCRHLDARPGDALMSSRANNVDLLVIGLVGVVVCTHVFTTAAQQLGWKPVAMSAALYLAGRSAELW